MFGKIFSSMFEGSMVGAGPVVFAVWSYCIAKSDMDGTVLLNPALLAPIIGTSRIDIESAIQYLQAPDPHSKNPDHEGRRLLHQTGHLYFIVSFEVYRDIKTNADRREYMREYMAKRRDKEAVNSLQSLQKLPTVNPASASTSTSTSQRGGCKGEKDETPPPKESVVLPFESPEFKDAWDAYKEHRRKLKTPMTDRSQRLNLGKLPDSEPEAIRWINTAIEKGWKGLYEPKANGNTYSRPAGTPVNHIKNPRERMMAQ